LRFLPLLALLLGLSELPLSAATVDSGAAPVASTLPNGAGVVLLGFSGSPYAGITLAVRSPFPPGTDSSRVFLRALALLLRDRLAQGLPKTIVAPLGSPGLATLLTTDDPLLLLTLTCESSQAATALSSWMAALRAVRQTSPARLAAVLSEPRVLRRSSVDVTVALLSEPSPRLQDNSLSPDDFLSGLAQALAPSNLALAASLPGDATEFAAHIVAVLGSLSGQAAYTEPALPAAQVSARIEHSGSLSRLCSVLVHPLRSPTDYATLELACLLLGRARFSRVYGAARSQAAITYDVDARLLTMGHLGMVAVGCTVPSRWAHEALSVLRTQFRSLTDSGPTEAELGQAKALVTFEHARLRDTPADWSLATAARLANLGPQGLDLPLQETIDSIDTLEMKRFLSGLASWSATLETGPP